MRDQAQSCRPVEWPVAERITSAEPPAASPDQTQEQLARLQAILVSISESTWACDAAGHPIFVNEATLRFLGIESTPETRQKLATIVEAVQLYRPDGTPIPRHEQHLARALRGETIIGDELRYRLPGGPLRWARISTAPVRDEQGHITGTVATAIDITANKEAQAERERLLAERETAQRNLQAILDRLSDVVVVLDTNQRVILNNETLRRYLGRDIVGMSLAEAWPTFGYTPAGGQAFPEGQTPVLRALRGEVVTGVEVHVTLPDGRQFDLEESAAPLHDVEGHVTGVVVTVTDITARKAAQTERERLLAQVENARQELYTALNRLPDGVMVIDRHQRVLLHNATITGYLGRDVHGVSLADLRREYGFTMADGRPFAPGQTPIERALHGETVTGVEVRLDLPGGRRTLALESVAPLFEPDGERNGHIRGAVLALTDITAQKKAQAEREHLLAELESAHRNLQTILDSLPEATLVVDAGMRITVVNQAARSLVGRDLRGISAQEAWQAFGFADPSGRPFPPGESPLERAVRGEKVTGVQASARLPDGRHIDLLESAVPLRDPGGAVREVVVVLADITPLKELDRAKDEFISVAAHELRNPLTSLKGHAQVLLRRAAKANWRPEDVRSLQVIDAQVDRLNDLIGRLLDVSRIRLGRLQLHRQQVDLPDLARGLVEEMQVTTEAHRIVLDAALPHLVGFWDSAAIRQVLANLVGNAIKYAPGGEIRVRIRQEGDWALVSVSDQGPGIPPEQQVRLFEAFARGAAAEQRRMGGLGLGLYISRGIVEAHGGRIWVESTPGVGSTFSFTLPLTVSGAGSHACVDCGVTAQADSP